MKSARVLFSSVFVSSLWVAAAAVLVLPGCGLFGHKKKTPPAKPRAHAEKVTSEPKLPPPLPEPNPNKIADKIPALPPDPEDKPKTEKTDNSVVKTDPTTGKPIYPTAEPVPGKPNMVYSPYNHREIAIDPEKMPSGKLVGDPTYPASAKKFFRVP